MTSKVLAFEEIATPPKSVQDELQLNPNDTVYYLERLRFVDEDILCIEYSYYHKEVVKYLTAEIAKGSIFDYLESNMKLRVGFSDIFFNVDQLTSSEAALLQLSAGEPCLRYHQTFYTMTGKPLIHLTSYFIIVMHSFISQVKVVHTSKRLYSSYQPEYRRFR